jgi:hypothetical protein
LLKLVLQAAVYQLAYDPAVAGIVEIPHLVHRSS